jgi:aspartate kinase
MQKDIKVFKFGGASIRNSEGMKNVTQIIRDYKDCPLVVVVSALGKTTNALEEVVATYFQNPILAAQKLELIKEQHYALASELMGGGCEDLLSLLNDVFVEADWILEDNPQDTYDYVYDQIVSLGELASSRILAAYLQKCGLNCDWLDARDLILTDETWREATVLWDDTSEKIAQRVSSILTESRIVLTQGFIGATKDNATTTLGREGSDYSAAIISFCLNAKSMTIWKDVEGVLTADPRLFKNVTKLDRLSYREAIEMTYYGATVIHPKTIKPLQNKNIPLLVKSFVNPEGSGTLITGEWDDMTYPPMIMVEKNQLLLHISTKDYSFLVEHHIKDLFTIFDQFRIFVNMMQNTAISFYACVTNVPDRIPQVIRALEDKFYIHVDDNLELITIRHSQPQVYEMVKERKVVLFEEHMGATIQMVVRDLPGMEWK